jgi:beta-lactamase regulating signal transducer with metallopeptidase domain
MFAELLPMIQSGARWALEALANGLWQGLLLTTVLALTLKFGPRLRARSRYALWFFALIAVVALPALSTQRAIGVHALDAYNIAENAVSESIASLTASDNAEVKASLTDSQPDASDEFDTIDSDTDTESNTESSYAGIADDSNRDSNVSSANLTSNDTKSAPETFFAVSETPLDSDSPTPIASRANGGSVESAEAAAFTLSLPDWLALGILFLWLAVSSVFIIRLAYSFEHLRKLRRDSHSVDSSTLARFTALADALKLKRNVRYLLSDRVSSPLAVGLGSPAVIFPETLFTQLSNSEKDQIVLHELTHLKRYDDWGALAQQLLRALFFFNPAAIWISQRLDLERELACDESVVENMEAYLGSPGAARDYAGCLTRLAELSAEPRHSALAAGAFFSGKRLSLRVERILHSKFRFSPRFSRAVVATLGLFIVGALVQFTLAPKVVAFDEREEARKLAEKSAGIHVVPSSSHGYSYSYSYGNSNGHIAPIAALDSDYDYSKPERMRELQERLKELRSRRSESEAARREYVRQLRKYRNLRSHAQGHIESVAPNVYRYYRDDEGRDNSVFVAPMVDRDFWGDNIAQPVITVIENDKLRALASAPRAEAYSRGFASAQDVPRPPRPPRAPRVPSVSVISTPSIAGIGNFSSFFDNDDGEINYSWNSGSKHFKVRARGEIVFNEAGTDVESISDEGYITIRERTRKYDREYEVYAEDDGTLDRTYFDDGRRSEIDDEAREWISESILDVIRKSGIGAEARVEKLYDEGGVDAVLDEIDEIESNHSQRIYYALLLERNLENADVAKVIRHVGLVMDSDYEHAELLSGLDAEYLENDAVLTAYIDAITGIDSDYEKRRALSNVFDRRELPSKTLVELLALAEEFDSDYERSQLLGSIADRGLSDVTLREAYIDAIAGISSDYEKRQALSKIADREDLEEASLLAALALAETISSDYERSQLLMELFPEDKLDGAVLRAYIRAIEDISSNYEKRRVLNELVDRGEMDSEIVMAILQMAGSISSDYERAELLKDLAEFCRDTELWTAYVVAVEDIDSDYEKGRVLAQMELDEPVDKTLMLSALGIIESMTSDFEKAKLLRKFADVCLENDDLREPFLDAVDTIDSDYERNSLLDKIYKRDRRERRKNR